MSAADGDAQMRALLRQSLSMIETLERELNVLRQPRRQDEPVAIIGLSCDLPGAHGPAALWQALESGADAIGPVPADRWNAWQLLESERGSPGRIASALGGFIGHLREFDADFFGIAPKEANSLDPQQRLLLELTWQAIEHAGLDAHALRDSRTGVFIGICGNDYQHLLMQRAPEDIDAYMCSGTCHSTAAGRLSYWLGLKGPSLAVDTACSSSLVALHLACRSIASGESDFAFVGGVNRILLPQVHINFSQARMLSPQGRCKAFDDSADGFVRAEGGGVLVLKGLKAAQRDGDRIVAVIAGSAVNQDGRSSGLTVPNGPSQQAVIREALANAGIAVADVDYVEAHGTGTALGDPIEIESLSGVFAESHRHRPLPIGSVKANLGHLEAAAGIASVIKVALALSKGVVPPQIHCERPSRHVDWQRSPLRIPAIAEPWHGRSGRRVAGVSSFGFSGTNVHAVMCEAPSAMPATLAPAPAILTLSARSPEALCQLAAAYADALPDENGLPAFCAAAAVRRSHLPWRLALDGRDRAMLQRQLREPTLPIHGVNRPLRAAFVFSPNSSGDLALAAPLRRTVPGFERSLDHVLAQAPGDCVTALRACFGTSQTSADPAIAAGAHCVLQLALTRVWRELGIDPVGVVGLHSGEWAAAVAAGAMDEGAAIAGAMAALPAAHRLLHRINATPTVVETMLSGAADFALVARCDEHEWIIQGSKPAVERHFGSLSASLSAAGTLLADSWSDGTVGLACRTTPRMAWVRAADGKRYGLSVEARRSPPEFDAVAVAQALADLDVDALIEIGIGDQTACWLVRPAALRTIPVLACLDEDPSGSQRLIDSLCRAYRLGASVRWQAWFGTGIPPVDLPPHPFLRQPYWAIALPGAATEATECGPVSTQHLFDLLTVSTGVAPAIPAPAPEPDLTSGIAARLALLPETRRGEELLDALAAELAVVLGRRDAASIRVDDGFQAQGVDSLMALQLRKRVERLCGRVFPATMIYEFPNLRALSRHLLADWFSPPVATGEGQVSGAATAVALVDLLELEKLIERELEQLKG